MQGHSIWQGIARTLASQQAPPLLGGALESFLQRSPVPANPVSIQIVVFPSLQLLVRGAPVFIEFITMPLSEHL